MIYTQPIEFTSIEDIVNNHNKYKDIFLNDSILVFRNANLSYDDQVIFHKNLGKHFNWHAYTEQDGNTSKYIEDHSQNKNVGKSTGDEIMLKWHMEHIYYDNPIVAATWNMVTFNTDNNNGKTYFIDSEKIYATMPDDWKNFLESCTVNGRSTDVGSFNVIKNHWITGNKVLRMMVTTDEERLVHSFFVNDNAPSEKEIKLFKEIILWFGNEVNTNEDIRIVHKWKQGDLVIPDMFKLAHAVTGGFNPIDRKFIGIWGYKDKK